jgi:transcriptional regulator with XRE-family HTH domain
MSLKDIELNRIVLDDVAERVGAMRVMLAQFEMMLNDPTVKEDAEVVKGFDIELRESLNSLKKIQSSSVVLNVYDTKI